MTIKPGHKHADYFAKWLMLNRQGNHWYSTKDTSAALYGMTLYMSHHNELTPDCSVKISVNGKEIGDGKLNIDVEMKGECSVYANAFLSYFTKEAKIEASGNEIFVERTYYKLKEKKKKVKTWRGVITKLDYERIELKEGDEVKSGGVFQHGTWINREMRDEKVVNFFYRLPQGKQAITYKMRAAREGHLRFERNDHHGLIAITFLPRVSLFWVGEPLGYTR